MEHNIFCVSAHYRNCPGECWQQVVATVEEVLSTKSNELKITRGRKVVEIRPKVRFGGARVVGAAFSWKPDAGHVLALVAGCLLVMFRQPGPQPTDLSCLSQSLVPAAKV